MPFPFGPQNPSAFRAIKAAREANEGVRSEVARSRRQPRVGLRDLFGDVLAPAKAPEPVAESELEARYLALLAEGVPPEEAGARAVGSERAAAKDRVQTRYFELLAGGLSPNSSAACLISEAAGRRSASESPRPASGGERRPFAGGTSFHLTAVGDEDCASGPEATQQPFSSPHHGSGSGTGVAKREPSPYMLREANCHNWKTFGIGHCAGRSLKTLYPGIPLPKEIRQAPPIKGYETFVVQNKMRLGTNGLPFRRSMHLFDECPGAGQYAPWGTCVHGTRVNAEWVKVGDQYLPVTVNSIKLLSRRPDRPKAIAPMGRACSLPAL